MWDICTPPLLSHSRVDSLQRLRGYTYTCRLRDGTLHLVTPVWGRAPLYSGFFFENDGGAHAPRDERPIAAALAWPAPPAWAGWPRPCLPGLSTGCSSATRRRTCRCLPDTHCPKRPVAGQGRHVLGRAAGRAHGRVAVGSCAAASSAAAAAGRRGLPGRPGLGGGRGCWGLGCLGAVSMHAYLAARCWPGRTDTLGGG
eukprot:SAG25_NODE_281_length_10457_cov_12.574339_1_plen_199_part_00